MPSTKPLLSHLKRYPGSSLGCSIDFFPFQSVVLQGSMGKISPWCDSCCHLYIDLGLRRIKNFLTSYEETGCKYCLLLWSSITTFVDKDHTRILSNTAILIDIQPPVDDLLRCSIIPFPYSDEEAVSATSIQFHLLQGTLALLFLNKSVDLCRLLPSQNDHDYSRSRYLP